MSDFIDGVINRVETNDPTLTSLDFTGNYTPRPQLDALLEGLKTNTNVTELSLSENELGPEEVESIAEMLKVNNTLTKLDLSVNSFYGQGAIALAEALKINHTLTDLNLTDNCIEGEGGEAIGEMLKVNKGLKKLSLYFCTITDVGGIAVVEALREDNKTLIDLDLGENMITDATMMVLTEVLKANTTLQRLGLAMNFVCDQEATDALVEAFTVNTTLTWLNIELQYKFGEIKDKLVCCITDTRMIV